MPSGYPIPNWIRPPEDPAQAYISAFRAGSAVAEAQAHLQSQADQQATELAVSEQRLKGQQMREQQELEMTKAYHQATLGLRQQELAQTQQRIGMAAQNAAERLVAQTKYGQLVQSGVDPVEALLKSGPGLFPSGTGLASAAKALSEKQHPFVPTDVTTPGGVKLVHTSPNRYTLAPAEPSKDVEEVVDSKGNVIPGMVRFGHQVRNIPGYVNPNLQEIKEIYKNWGPYIVGQATTTDPAEAKRFEAAKKRLDELGGVQSRATQAKGPVALPSKKEDLIIDQVYQTSRGAATWNGKNFVQ